MLKKILIGLAVVVVLVLLALVYLNYRNRTLSPPGSVVLTNENLTISVTYSRPSVKGRLIFGTQEEGALQPYGKYWRLGANESTEVTFNRDVTLDGQLLKSGTYRLYAMPGADSFELIVNTELGKWGYSEPDHSFDIMHVTVPVTTIDSPVEQFTIGLQPSEEGIDIVFEWSNTRLVLPVK